MKLNLRWISKITVDVGQCKNLMALLQHGFLSESDGSGELLTIECAFRHISTYLYYELINLIICNVRFIIVANKVTSSPD